MTENQWNTTGDSSKQHADAVFETTPAATDSEGGPASKTEAVKEEASNVAGHAAAASQGVAETAKEEVANVAAEAKSSAHDLLAQAKSELASQAGAQQQKAAEGMRSISAELRAMADASDEPGVASDLVRQAAARSQSAASWLDGRDPGSLLNEVQNFARQRPGTFLLLAAGAGVLAGRLGRSLQAGAPASTGTPSPAVHQTAYPTTEPSITAGIGEPFYEEPIVGGPALAEPPYGQPAYGEPAFGEPVRPATVADPYNEGEGRHL